MNIFIGRFEQNQAFARVLDIVGDDLTLGDELLRSLLRERKPELAGVPASPRLVRQSDLMSRMLTSLIPV